MDDLSVSVFHASATSIITQHTLARQNACVVAGNQVAAASVATTDARRTCYNLAGVDVPTSQKTNVVVTFGDSITDGVASTVDGNKRGPNDLAIRLAADAAAGLVAVVNTGISGNRILNDAVGPKAVDRLDRDVLSAYDSGDHLHPNDAGYQAMADAIPLAPFRVAC